MEHNFGNRDGLPMAFIVNTKDRQVSFASDDIVMPGDTVVAIGYKGEIKEVIEERPAKGRWKEIGDGHTPTFYKVQLH